jgi:hypothetical protein
MDSTTFTIGASVVLVLSLVIYQVGKPTPLPLIPHNKLPWFVGDIPFLTRLAKEKGAITYAFDDTAMRLGPVSQVRGYHLIPGAVVNIFYRSWLDSEPLGPADYSVLGKPLLFSQYVLSISAAHALF